MVTINDVADAAGVAPSTVSYVLSGKRSISPRTRRVVETAIRKLGYHPHAGARALASNRTNVLALVVPLRADLNVSVVMEFVASAATAAREHDQDLLLVTKNEGPAALQRIASSAIADALMVMDVEVSDSRLPVLVALDRPTVLIGVPDYPAGLSCVDLDFTAAGAACVAHLGDLGHRRVALIGPTPAVYQRGTSYATRFLHGFAEEAKRREIHAITQECTGSYEASHTALDALFTRDPGITGLIVHNEAALPALLSGLRQRNLRVPEDISVVAVCPDSMAGQHATGLTTVAIPAEEIGAQAVEMTMRHLGGHTTPEIRLLSPRLTTRDSTAPPRPEPVS
ncbi:LacI family DNA-binding transcriptional regulator [Amycolatopsis sp. NPDC059657]|uniref:LacI family DNA-binding transcriptional regulator n=1 Tax=Amycolatopsis sp. NPDC059657 TaxID=3346899 RepID=UPI00366F437A